VRDEILTTEDVCALLKIKSDRSRIGRGRRPFALVTALVRYQ